MSWLGDGGGDWPFRFPVGVWNSGGAGTSDAQFAIPATFGKFWDEIDSDGHELRVTGPDGVSVLNYKRSVWTYSTRSAAIQIEDLDLPASGTAQIFLYWGQADASDGAGSFTASGVATGQVTNLAPRGSRVAFQAERFGATVPSQRVVKTADESQDVWWDVSDVLQDAAVPSGGHLNGEEIKFVDFAVYNDDNPQAAMLDEDLTHLVEFQGGSKKWVRTRWKAGTAGQSYTLRLTITTTTDREIQGRIVGLVTNLTE